MYIYILYYGCFLKWGTPKIIHINRSFHYYLIHCPWKPPKLDETVAGLGPKPRQAPKMEI